MAFIFKGLRDWAKRPLDEPQDIMDWLVFGHRPHKPKPIPIKKPEAVDESSRLDDLIKDVRNENLSPSGNAPPSIIPTPSIVAPPPVPPSFIPPAPPLPSNIPPAPPLPSSVPPAPPLPPSLPIPKPSKDSIIFEQSKPEAVENPRDAFLDSIRQGVKLKPNKPQKQPSIPTLFDEIKKPKLIKNRVVKQKEPKIKEPTLNDLIKSNKKFQALSRQTETKNEDFVDEDWGFGKKKRKRRLLRF
jgi:hypothetical protein